MIKCIAIDDEPLALKQMISCVQKTPFLQLVGECSNAFEAIEVLQNNIVDVLFIDINMPDLSGMDFVKSLKNAPLIIFTTAYSEFAVEGFKINALNYLLKPIGYADFLKAAYKAKATLEKNAPANNSVNHDDKFIFAKTEYRIVKIKTDDILYVEGMREYVRIHIEKEKPVMSLLSMKSIEKELPNNFMRVHRSYIVNLNKVSVIERNRIVFDKTYIPVSESYKKKFQQFLSENSLM